MEQEPVLLTVLGHMRWSTLIFRSSWCGNVRHASVHRCSYTNGMWHKRPSGLLSYIWTVLHAVLQQCHTMKLDWYRYILNSLPFAENIKRHNVNNKNCGKLQKLRRISDVWSDLLATFYDNLEFVILWNLNIGYFSAKTYIQSINFLEPILQDFWCDRLCI